MNEKIVETKQCRSCSEVFPITQSDIGFYEKISPSFWGEKYLLPTPRLCPSCRQQRRLSFLNFRHLYPSDCKWCGKQIVSRFSPDSEIKNYCNKCWSDENWDQLEQGIFPDFNKSIFAQFHVLLKQTYFQNLIGSSSNIINNAVYTNHTSEIHNSYFVSEANTIEDSYYGHNLKNSSNIVDSMFIGNSQICYESVDCYDSYGVFFAYNSFGSKNSYFIDNCQNCSYCIGCVNLVAKSYHIFNDPVSKEEFEKYKEQFWSYAFLEEFKSKFVEYRKTHVMQANNIIQSEEVSGNNIVNSHRVFDSYDVLECEDCKYCNSINYSKDLFDVSSYGEESYMMYESVSVWRFSNNILLSGVVGKGENLIYCIDVKKSKNCFLCVNLEHKEYCILNKQYTKQEYENLVPKIIDYMRVIWEWGEFFPSSISPLPYNKTVAQDFFPLQRDEAKQRDLYWSDYVSAMPKVDKIISAKKLPNDIKDIPEDVLNWAIKCEQTDKPFRIIPQEFEFYKKHNLALPRKHPDTRHTDRMEKRLPRRLLEQDCSSCWEKIMTPHEVQDIWIIHCAKCYKSEIY